MTSTIFYWRSMVSPAWSLNIPDF